MGFSSDMVYHSSLTRPDAGFTLVELAISLMVIGLLIAGVVTGNEIMNNARNTRMMAQVKQYDTTMVAFRDIYGGLPGDFLEANTRIVGCHHSESCFSGSGNGEIGLAHNATSQLNKLAGGLGSPGINHENGSAWKHLATARMISSVDPDASNPPLRAGYNYPPTPWRRQAYDVYFWHDNNVLMPTGHYLKTKSPALDNIVTPMISSKMARVVDRKYDDGRPLSGNIFGWAPDNNCVSGSQYAMGDEGVCELTFRLSF